MGIFSSLKDSLFGDEGEGAAAEQREQNAASRAYLEEQVGRAREEVMPLFQNAQDSRLLGSQAALDVFGQSIPEQLNAFLSGNQNAQEALLAGGLQSRNAILGLPVNSYSAYRPPIQIDTSFTQQQLPEFQTQTQALNPEPAPAPEGQFDAASLLGQNGRFGRFGYNQNRWW